MRVLSKEIASVATIATISLLFLKCTSAFSFGGYEPQQQPKYPPQVPTPEQREEVVRRYFDGVTTKNPNQIYSCFAEEAYITDICSINASKRRVSSELLTDRCMEFLAAHPDCRVDFHYPPTCARNSNWVFAHWYETGHWTGDSQGIRATGNPMACEGQTRFYVNDQLQITEFVVTRTFTEWENVLQQMSRAPVNHMQQQQPQQQQQQQQPQQQRNVPVDAQRQRGLDWTQPGGAMRANNAQRQPQQQQQRQRQPQRRVAEPQKPVTFRSNSLDLDGNKLSFTSRNTGGKEKKRTGMTWSD